MAVSIRFEETRNVNAPAIDFRQGKRKPVMNRKPGLCTNDISGARDLRARKIDYLKTAAEQCLLLFVREAQQLILKQSVWDQDLEEQQEKDRKHGGFAKINEAAQRESSVK
jgi:hypothetical protein